MPQVSKASNNTQEYDLSEEEEDPDIAKIKKVQSFFRGWLCRRRWKQIVDEYIRSPHAESMRKRKEIHSLRFLIFSLFPPSLSISCIKRSHIL